MGTVARHPVAHGKSGMIVLFTDFGLEGPYVGQVKARLHAEAPGVPVVDLMSDAPRFDARRASYLLAAYAPAFPMAAVFLGVVDPGVGGARDAVAVAAGGQWFVGPDNGLFEIVSRRAGDAETWDIDWRPEKLSASFHGRDLFAPVAARIALGARPPGRRRPPAPSAHAGWPDDLGEIVYFDHYGNAVTGLRADGVDEKSLVVVGDNNFSNAKTFSRVPPGRAFWYENANGLVEIAVNQGSAAERLGLEIGAQVRIEDAAPSGGGRGRE